MNIPALSLLLVLSAFLLLPKEDIIPINVNSRLEALCTPVLQVLLRAPIERIILQGADQYLFSTKESNDEVSSRLAEGMKMHITKLCPNIIISGAPAAYDEDFWAEMVLSGGIKMLEGPAGGVKRLPSTGKRAEDDGGLVWKKLGIDRRVPCPCA